MPILLLPELAAGLRKLGTQLGGWPRLTEIEELLLRRARGAFLVRWFGRGVPERQLSLLIVIANIDALRERYALVKQSMPGPLPPMTLLRPLAGMAGFATGLFFSLSGVFLFAPHIRRMFEILTDSWWREPATLFYSVVLNWIMPLLNPVLVVGLGVPFLVGWALAMALGGDRESRAIVRLMGDAAMMVDAFLAFWDQVTGPVERIRNPLVRAIVTILHRFAGLYAQVLGFVAVLVVKLVPLIPSLIEQFRAAAELGRAVLATITDITGGFVDALMAPFNARGGLFAVLMSVFDAIMALPGQLVQRIREAIADTLVEFSLAYAAFNRMVADYVEGLGGRIVEAFKQTLVGQLIDRIKTLLALVPQVAVAFASSAGSGGGGGGGGSGKPTDLDELDRTLRSRKARWATGGVFGEGVSENIADLLQAVRDISLPTLPSFELPALPSPPTLPDVPALRSSIGLPGPIDFAGEAARLLERAQAEQSARPLPEEILRRPRSAFAAERDRLHAIGPQLTEQDRRLRDLIYLAVGRVLPPALRVHAPKVRAMFDELDQRIFGGAPPAPAEDLPQLELPNSGRLRPIVQQLTIRSRGGFAVDLRAFRDFVVDAMTAQTYVAPDAA